MLLLAAATACAGTFFGAAIYINVVEHPARVSCGPELALREFGPSYRRAAIMQGALAVLGCLIGLLGAWMLRDAVVAGAAVLLGLGLSALAAIPVVAAHRKRKRWFEMDKLRHEGNVGLPPAGSLLGMKG